jgi:hypothetical protein
MVELKISQGAKSGHGGVLPAAKASEEIALTSGVPMGCALAVAGVGVPQDDVQAYMWPNLSVARGIKRAAEERDKLTQSMTPAQIALARERKPTAGRRCDCDATSLLSSRRNSAR